MYPHGYNYSVSPKIRQGFILNFAPKMHWGLFSVNVLFSGKQSILLYTIKSFPTYGYPVQGILSIVKRGLPYPSSGATLGLCSLLKATQVGSFPMRYSGELNSQYLAPHQITKSLDYPKIHNGVN